MNHSSYVFGLILAFAGWTVSVYAEEADSSTTVEVSPLEINIPAQAVGDALNEFAAQADLQIVLYSDIASGLESKPISGRFENQDVALAALLRSTGLSYEFLNNNTIAIRATEQAQDGESGKSQPASNKTLIAQAGASAQQQMTATTTADSGAEKTETGRNIIEEVIVTARRREENLQDVPISISAYSAADMEARSFTNLRDLGEFTPNFNFYNHGDTGQTSAVVVIRGVGQTGANIYMDPGVGVYIDGVYLGRMQGVDFDLMDLERVEVLRGPQGTLFGKNTMGGVINMISARPGDDFSGSVELTTGRFNRLDGKAIVNIPLVPGKLAAKFSVATRNRDGYGERLDFFTGQKIDEMGDVERTSGRAVFDWTPNDRVDVLLSLDASKMRQTGPVRKVVEFGQPPIIKLLNIFVDPPYGDVFMTNNDFTTFSNGGNTNNVDAWGTALTVDWDIESWAVKSITSYREMDSLNDVDPDGSIYQIINLLNTINQKQFSQELQISGVSFADRLNWIGGLYYFEEKASTDQTTTVMGDLKDIIGLDLTIFIKPASSVKHYAAFGQGTYAINDKLSLTAGIRYSYDQKEVSRDITGRFNVPWESRSANWGAFSGRFGMEYTWDDDVMTYVSVARGFKSGGIFAHATTSNAFQSFDPEYIWTYEIGMKSDFLDHRIRFNTSLFYSQYDDIQFRVTTADPVTLAPITIMDNVAAAEVKGFEVEIVAAPAQGLTLSAAVGFTDAKYTKADPASPVNETSKFTKTPKWTAILAGQYTVPVKKWGELISRVDYAYKSKVYHDTLNSPRATQAGYGLLNMSLTFATLDSNWSVSMFGSNLMDKRYILAGTDFVGGLGFAEVQYARPREWGVRLTYRY